MNDSPEQRKEAIFLALMQIPEGKVISYGDLATLAGITKGARQVGKAMSQLPDKSKLPWHRVINSQGKISLPPGSPSHDEQIKRLKAEGIEVINGKIKMSVYRYNP